LNFNGILLGLCGFASVRSESSRIFGKTLSKTNSQEFSIVSRCIFKVCLFVVEDLIYFHDFSNFSRTNLVDKLDKLKYKT